MNRSARGTVVLTILFLGGGCLIGGMLASHAQVDADKTVTQVRTFGRILALVEDNSVSKVESKDMVENAIQGMLHTLDPHSNYLNREAYSEMKDEQRGSFHGLGIQITKRGPDKPLTILAPIDGTPAAKAGLQPGDVISKIEGQDTIDLTVQDAVRKLKGEKGTKVTITIQRPGEEDSAPFDVTLVRDEIPTKSLAHSYMVQPGVGLIRISNFTSTTTAELDDAIETLKAKGMDRLILDLRSNPGGLLDQAVGVSSRFIPEGKLVVYTRGRIPGSDQDYTAKGDERTDVPLVVLVDHSSASASEIVSGAIQDHDRGLVVGVTTFGKGLVQRVIPLRDGGALALTTAKYYTPAGRLIQRDYTDLDDYFLDPELEGDAPAPETSVSGREQRKTDSGRIVYGGGGITPDYIVPNEKEPLVISRMRRENQLFDFAVKYVARHPQLKPDFAVDDAMMKSYKEFLTQRKFRLEDGVFEQSRKAIETRLRSQIARVKWGAEAETRVLAEGDPQVQKALTLFEEAAKLAQAGELGRREKMQGNETKPTDLKAASPAG
jgi:carboxyl-terminal processing protease